MEHCTCLNPEALSGVLKTIYLFLEGQNFRETCKTFLSESRGMGFAEVKKAIACLLVLKPTSVEAVSVSHADCAKSAFQIQAEMAQEAEVDASSKYLHIYYGEPLCIRPLKPTASSSNINDRPKTCPCKPTCKVAKKTDRADRRDDREKASASNMQTAIPEDTEVLLRMEYYKEGTPSSTTISKRSNISRVKYEITTVEMPDGTIGPPSVASSNVRYLTPASTSGSFTSSISPLCSPKLKTPHPSLVILQEAENPCVPVHPTSSVRFDINTRVLQPIISREEIEIVRNLGAVPSYPTTIPQPQLDRISNTCETNRIENPSDLRKSSSRSLARSCNANLHSQHHLCATQSRVCNHVANLDETAPCGGKSPCTTVAPCSEVSPCGHIPDQGETPSPIRVASKSILPKGSKFGSSIGVQIEDCLRKNVDTSTATAQASVVTSVAHSSVSTRTLQAQYQLDYGKIKRELRWGCPSVKMMLLQALRWRLTQSDERRRNEVMSDYARHDLLSFHGSPKNHTILVEDFLCTNSIQLGPQHQEGMARMVNAIASLTLGRDYLCQDEKLLTKIIIPLLMDTHPLKKLLLQTTAEFLWVALQKLSLRNNMRLIMIQAGLAEYLMSYLSQHRNLVSDYCLEYCLALFMNLCLHNEAIVRIKKKARDVIHFVSDFLSNDLDDSCLSYINGAMYSLFMDPDIRKEARHAHLDTKLADKSMSVDEEIRQQLEVILELLNSNKLGYGCYKCDCIDQCDEIDHLESEIEEGDITSGTPNGEALLNLYLVVNESAEPDTIPLTCMCRPATPSKKISAAERCPHSYDESSLEVDTKPEPEKKNKGKCFAVCKKAKAQEDSENGLECPKTDAVCCPVEDERVPVKESNLSKASTGARCNAPSCTGIELEAQDECKKCLMARQRSTASLRRSPSSASQLSYTKCKCSKKAASTQQEQLPQPTPDPEPEEHPVVACRMSNWSTVKQEPTTTNMVMYASACQQCCAAEIAQYNRQQVLAATAPQNNATKSARSQQGLTVQTHSQQPLTHQSCSQQGLTQRSCSHHGLAQRSCSDLKRSRSQLARQNTVSEIVEVDVDPEFKVVVNRSAISASPPCQQDTETRSVMSKKSSAAQSGLDTIPAPVVVAHIATQSEQFTSHVSIQLSQPSINEPVPCSSQHVQCSTAEQPFIESHISPLMTPITNSTPVMQRKGEEEEAIAATIEESNFESIKSLIDKDECEGHTQGCRPICGAKSRKPQGSKESRTASKLFDSSRTSYAAPPFTKLSSSNIRARTQYRSNGQFAPYNTSCDPCRVYPSYNPCCREIPYCYNTNAYCKAQNQYCVCPGESSRVSYRTVSAVNQKNKYSCDCYNNVKQFVQSTDLSQYNSQINRNRNENPPEEPRNEREVSTPERELKDLEQALSSDSDNPCEFEMLRGSKIIDCECYSMVFQSRPKLPRTP